MEVFAAGAVVRRGDDLVLTLNTDDVPADGGGTRVRVGWVGGALEPGETPLECLAREADEELGASVAVQPAPAARLWDWSDERFADTDGAPPGGPLLVVRSRDLRHAVVYAARVDDGAPLRPGDDVVGLVVLPPALWPVVEAGTTLRDVEAAGAKVILARPLDPGTRLWVHPNAALRVAVPLVVGP